MVKIVLTHLREYRYELLAFVTGGTVMMLEVVGARLIAPYFGTSTYVWTAMIGVILAALAFGYWYGGRVADRGASHRSLAILLTVSALLILGSALFQEGILQNITQQRLDLRLSALVGAVILFGPPSFMVGMIAPQLAKIRVTSLEFTGRSIGRLEAMGALGSISGTFLSGYFLLAFFGARNLALSLVIVLILSSFMVERRFWLGQRLALAGITLLVMSVPVVLPSGVISDTDSAYMRYRVMESGTSPGQRLTHHLVTDNQSTQSAVYLDDPTEMVFSYTQNFMLAAKILAPSERILMIGGGAHTFPTALVRTFPELEVDVVEIDPALVTLATKYFGYQTSDRLHMNHADGRQFLNTTEATYDVAYMDAYSSLTPPFHLMTRETVEQLRHHLHKNGVVVVNVISRHQGGDDDYLRAVMATYRSAFSQVELFQASPGMPLEDRQNFIMVATNDEAQMKKFRASMPERPVEINPGGQVLTDDYAPVERLSY